jgi:hypothetical protein
MPLANDVSNNVTNGAGHNVIKTFTDIAPNQLVRPIACLALCLLEPGNPSLPELFSSSPMLVCNIFLSLLLLTGPVTMPPLSDCTSVDASNSSLLLL